jgi:catechol 2,3-dioxygenase-like lactoylglutathione lyase family enzyme
MRIRQLALDAGELGPLHAFYGELLGLAATPRDNSVDFAIGRSVLVFHQTPGFDGRYHFAFNTPPGRIGQAIKFIQNKGIQLLADADGKVLFEFDSWNATALYFYDPAGNIVELIERRNLPAPDPPNSGPFAVNEILEISEIGLATRDCQKLANQLKHRLSLSEYRDFSPTFIPLGDETGLLILVEEGRLWFPNTGVPAKILPYRLHLQLNDDVASIVCLSDAEIDLSPSWKFGEQEDGL